ncbi:MAG: NADH:flavin oxidoreductase/NADH oxidase, partial [Ginsengibacter sp.]
SIDGFANDWHLVHLGSRAIGGASLVFTEATSVSSEGRISPDDLGLWKDEQVIFLRRITTFIKNNGAKAGIQLAHAGRKASHESPWKGGKQLKEEEGGWQTLAPSAVSYKTGESVPLEMNIEQIQQLVEDFKNATIRAIGAGFDIIEIHAAHGYLINEFLSPLSNFRIDEYGGTFENRIRILLETVNAMRQVMPEKMPLFVRISAEDWVEGGWNINDSVKLAMVLKNKGVDLIDCSSGGISRAQNIPVAPLYQLDFAAEVKKETGILTGAVGLITKTEQAQNIILENKADLVFMAREFLRDPYFPLHAAFTLDENIEWPVQYERAILKKAGSK